MCEKIEKFEKCDNYRTCLILSPLIINKYLCGLVVVYSIDEPLAGLGTLIES